MSHLITEDAVCYTMGESERNDFNRYHGTEFDKLRQYYYAFFMHGGKIGAHIYDDPFEFAPILKSWHKNYGKNRAVLLVTCWAGWTFARPLARNTGIPILAGLSLVHFGTSFSGGKTTGTYLAVGDKDYMKLMGETDSFRPEWVFYHASGDFEVLPGGHILDHNEAIKMAKK